MMMQKNYIYRYQALDKFHVLHVILKRNEYMIDISDVVVSCVKYNYGGAYTTLQYAKRKNKQIMYFYK